MRQAQRINVNQTTRLHPNQWSSLEVRLLDLSATGFRAECEAKVIVGLAVHVDLPKIGPVEALVSWRRGIVFGAKFLRPIDLSACGFDLADGENLLATLLVQRASAHRSGRTREEQELKKQILANLPMLRAGTKA